ncbi:MAG TPA: hypothetical protein VGI99_02920 [Gemmataceae bacterium]|jgi:hypothetical protein
MLHTAIIALTTSILVVAPVSKTKEPPKTKTVFEYAKELEKEKPPWTLTTKFKESKHEGATIDGGDFPKDAKYTIRSTWIVLNPGDSIQLDGSKNQSGGFSFDYGKGGQTVVFHGENKSKNRNRSPVFGNRPLMDPESPKNRLSVHQSPG